MDYMNYINRTVKFSWFSDNIQSKSICSNVYCIPHIEHLKNSNKHISNIKLKKGFDKWYDRPRKAHLLYWRLHPEEYPFRN
jgi:hypothetical protein